MVGEKEFISVAGKGHCLLPTPGVRRMAYLLNLRSVDDR